MLSDDENENPSPQTQSSASRAVTAQPFGRSPLGDANGSAASPSASNAKWNRFVENVAAANEITSKSREEKQLLRLNQLSSPERAAIVLGALYSLEKRMKRTQRTLTETQEMVQELEPEVGNQDDELHLSSSQTTWLGKVAQSCVFQGFVEKYRDISVDDFEALVKSEIWTAYWSKTMKTCSSFKIKMNSEIKERVRAHRTALADKIRKYLVANPDPTQATLRSFFAPDIRNASIYTFSKAASEHHPYHRIAVLLPEVQRQPKTPGGFRWAEVDKVLEERYVTARATARQINAIPADKKIPPNKLLQQVYNMDKAVFDTLPIDETALAATLGRDDHSSPVAGSPNTSSSANNRARTPDDDEDYDFSRASPSTTGNKKKKSTGAGSSRKNGKNVTEKSRRAGPSNGDDGGDDEEGEEEEEDLNV